MEKLKVLDLFSGIGGFSLGLERTGGFETVAFCEIEEFPRKVLAKHWPEVPCYEDVTKLTGVILRQDGIAVDVITGGFPCQDVSVAGQQAGIDGARTGLWSECLRLVGDLRPDFAIFENVTNLLSGPDGNGAWFSRILRDLAGVGYDVEWHDIPASFIGAWHRRGRVWILAYPDEIGRRQGRPKKPILRQQDVQRQSTRSFAEWPGRSNLPAPVLCGTSDGVPQKVDRLKALGNAVVPQVVQMIGKAILHADQ